MLLQEKAHPKHLKVQGRTVMEEELRTILQVAAAVHLLLADALHYQPAAALMVEQPQSVGMSTCQLNQLLPGLPHLDVGH